MSAAFDRVHLDDVSRHFGRRRAVSHVTFSARSGDIVGLLGPNGAGKSTLISMIATLAKPTSGDIRYGDRRASEWGPALRSRIGLLAHELHLYPELSARQNLTFFANLYGLNAAAAVERRGYLGVTQLCLRVIDCRFVGLYGRVQLVH